VVEVGLRCIPTRQSPFQASQVVHGDRHVVRHRGLPVIQPPREDGCFVDGKSFTKASPPFFKGEEQGGVREGLDNKKKAQLNKQLRPKICEITQSQKSVIS